MKGFQVRWHFVTASLALGHLAGNLAETYSRSGRSLKPRKVFRAIPMTLAIVGAIAKNHVIKSDTKMNIKLGILLPWSEYKDRSKYEKRLSKALELEYLSFQDQLFNINLESFKCLPEGAGILQKGRAKKGKFWPPIGTVNILVPMLGYRNLSILLLKKGELIGDTTPYGMSWLIKQLQDDTSGYTEQQLIKAVCAAGANLNEKALTPLVRNIPKEYQQDELSCLTAAISRGRKAYTNLISNWIKSEYDFPLDEVVISGGTSHTFKPELLRLFKEEKNVTPTFAKGLEQRVIQHFKAQVRGNAMPSRLADLYGFFYYLKPAPLPALRQSEGVR